MRKRQHLIQRGFQFVFLLVLWGIISALDGITTQAQRPPDPLTVNVCGDMWVWRGVGNSLKQSTKWIYNLFPPVLSPDGSKIAYKSFARITADYLNRKSGIGNYDAPATIWLINPYTDETVRIADQQPDAYWDAPERSTNYRYVLRSNPVWSPDSKMIAWTEYIHEPNEPDVLQLVGYDLATKSLKVIVPALPKQYDSNYPTAGVLWGKSGLAVLNISAPSSSKAKPNVDIGLYTPEGKALLNIPLSAGAVASINQLAWITDQGNEYLSYQAGSKWRLIDPTTGKESDMVGVPELYSLTAHTGLSVFPNSKTWQITQSGQLSANIAGTYPFPLEARPGAGISISRDGQSVGYVEPVNDELFSRTVTIYAGKKATTITADCRSYLGVTGMAWGPTGWRVRH